MNNLSRRDVLKGISIGGAAIALGGIAHAKDAPKNNDDIKSNIVIIGGGLAGISLSAKLRREIPNAQITILDKSEIFHYEPGFTLISVGIYKEEDVVYDKAKYIPDGVKWIKHNVSKIDPNGNFVTLDNGENLSYEYLVLATGVEYDFEAIKGLSKEDILDPNVPISSMYLKEGAIKTNILMEKLAKEGGVGVFAEQKTPMKCSGANKKIVMMSEDRARLAGNRENGANSKTTINLYCGGKKLFAAPQYAAVMSEKMIARNINYNLAHQIIEVDKSRNVAIFEHYMTYKENGVEKVAKENVEVKYDWLHLAPRQKASKIYKEAGLSIESGDVDGNWVAVKGGKLQSAKYDNIFAIGDVCGFKMGKTGASVRKMYPILTKNLIATIKGEEIKDEYDGYTACPFITKYGKAIMVEFNWTGKPAPSMECFGATRESYINWIIKTQGFRPMVMSGMLRALV